jgi:hypothetical protein
MTDSTNSATHEGALVASKTESQDYIEPWEQALRLLENLTPHERREHLHMGIWGGPGPCGTVGCLAGLCSVNPWFEARGFTSDFRGIEDELVFTGVHPTNFFGERGYQMIFLETDRNYEELVDAVKAHIQYLKAGGDPNFIDDDKCSRVPNG